MGNVRPENEFSNGRRKETEAPPPYEFQEFPKAFFHIDGIHSISVQSQAEADTLGPEWSDKQPDSQTSEGNTPANDCPTCKELTLELGRVALRLGQTMDAKDAEIAALKAANDKLQAELKESKAKEHDKGGKKAGV